MVSSRPAALVIRATALAFALAGWGRLVGLDQGRLEVDAFGYFTTLSTTASAAWFLAAVAATTRDLARDGLLGPSTPSARAGGAVLAAALVTMLVHGVLLAPALGPGSWAEPTNVLTHVAIPAFVLVDWILLTPRGRLRLTDPLWWAVPPLAYVVVVHVRHAVDGWAYPYPFLDVDVLGVEGAIAALLGLVVGLEAIAFGLVAVDALVGGTARSARRVRGEP